MSETPPKPEPESQVLSFEEFTEASPARFNNFFLYFAGGFSGDVYQKAPHYQKFAEEHPELAASLCDSIQNKRDENLMTTESLKPFEHDLYEAYKIMRGYGVSDKDLFS